MPAPELMLKCYLCIVNQNNRIVRMKSEIKIALLTIVTLAVSFWGYRFIVGRNLLKPSNNYYVEYAQIDLLKKATDVTINGFPVGVVADIYIKPNDPDRKVVVVLDLKKDIRIPKNTRAVIVNTGFMGDKSVMLKYDQPCTGEDCAQNGDFLKGELQGYMAYLMGGDGSIDSYLNSVKKAFADMLDTLNQQMMSEQANTPLSQTITDLRKSLANLESTTAQVDVLMRRSSGKIEGALGNLDAITANLDQQKPQINSMIGNFNTVSKQIKEGNLEQTLTEVKTTLTKLQTALSSAEQTLGSVQTAMVKVNAGEGSLGKLLNDETLYKDITGLSSKVDSLMSDFQERPYRYMPLKSRSKVKKFDRLDAKSGNTQ
jgi:phospholipid/cholesterol/gamma-HCH transport system substrate-binding protein